MAEDPRNTEALAQDKAALEALENAERGQKQQVYDETEVDRKHEAARKAVDTHYEEELKSFENYGYNSGKFEGVRQIRRYEHQADKLAETFSKKVDAVLAGTQNGKEGAEVEFKGDLESRFLEKAPAIEDAQMLHRLLELDTENVKQDLDSVTERGKISMTRLNLYGDLNEEIKENILQRHEDFTLEQQNLRDRFEALQQPELDEYRDLEGNWGLGKKGRRRRELKKTVGKKVEKVDKKFKKFEKFHETFRAKLRKRFDDRDKKYRAGANAAEYNVNIMGGRVDAKLDQLRNSPGERQQFLNAIQAFMRDKKELGIFGILGITASKEAQIHLLEVVMSEDFGDTRKEIEAKEKVEKAADENTKENTKALKSIKKTKEAILDKELSLPKNIGDLANDLGVDRDEKRNSLTGMALVEAIEKHLFAKGEDLSEIYGTEDYTKIGEAARMKGLLLCLFENEKSTELMRNMPDQIKGSVFDYLAEQNRTLNPIEEDHTKARKIQQTVERLQSSNGVVAKAQRCISMEGDPEKQKAAIEDFLTAYNSLVPELEPFTATAEEKQWKAFFRAKTGVEYDTITQAVTAVTELAEKLRTYKEGEVDEYFKKEKQRAKELKVAETGVKQAEALYQELARSDSAQAATTNFNISAGGTQETGAQAPQREVDPRVGEALERLTKAQDDLAKLQGQEDLEPPKVDTAWQAQYGARLSELRDFPFVEKFPVKNKKEEESDLSSLLNTHLDQEAQQKLRDRFIERIEKANMFDSLTRMPEGKTVTLNLVQTPDHKIDVPGTFTTASQTAIKAEVEFSEPGRGISMVVKSGGGTTAKTGAKVKVFAKVVSGKTVVENAVIIPPGTDGDTSKRVTALCTNFSLN